MARRTRPKRILWENEEVPAPDFNDVLHPEAADCAVLGTYQGNYYGGKPGLTAHPFGSGTAYAFGAVVFGGGRAPLPDAVRYRLP